MDFYDLENKIKQYNQGRKDYIKKIEEAKTDLKEYDNNAQSVLSKLIKERKDSDFKIFCKSAKYLYKNRDEIIKSGNGSLIIDFLNFNYSNKIYLTDLLNAWEQGFTIIDGDDECLIIGFKDYTVTDFDKDDSEVTYLKTGEIKVTRLSRTDTDNLLYSIDVDILSTKLDNKYTDFDEYHKFIEIPHKFLNIEEW